MEDTKVQTPIAFALIHAVPLQAVAAPGGFPTAAPLAIIQEGSQATGVVGNAQVDNRVLQQLRWIEKMIYVCMFLALYAIFKKYVAVCVSSHGLMDGYMDGCMNESMFNDE
jgi:hypothetical protein